MRLRFLCPLFAYKLILHFPHFYAFIIYFRGMCLHVLHWAMEITSLLEDLGLRGFTNELV